jgi:hypothetical protein
MFICGRKSAIAFYTVIFDDPMGDRIDHENIAIRFLQGKRDLSFDFKS